MIMHVTPKEIPGVGKWSPRTSSIAVIYHTTYLKGSEVEIQELEIPYDSYVPIMKILYPDKLQKL